MPRTNSRHAADDSALHHLTPPNLNGPRLAVPCPTKPYPALPYLAMAFTTAQERPKTLLAADDSASPNSALPRRTMLYPTAPSPA